MNMKVNSYFEGLKAETSPIKLFIPIFIGFAAVLEIVYPAILYFIKTFWKHQTFEFPNPLYGLIAALLFATALSLIISRNHRARQQEKDN